MIVGMGVAAVVMMAGFPRPMTMPIESVAGFALAPTQVFATTEDAGSRRPQTRQNKGHKQEAGKSQTNAMRFADASAHGINCSPTILYMSSGATPPELRLRRGLLRVGHRAHRLRKGFSAGGISFQAHGLGSFEPEPPHAFLWFRRREPPLQATRSWPVGRGLLARKNFST